MRWPWSKQVETRASYTDAVVQAILSQASGDSAGDPGALGALETASGLYARAFASATVSPINSRTAAITPGLLSLIARNLIRRGDSLHLIEVEGGEIRLSPVGTWDISGGDREGGWMVRADLFGPSGSRSVSRPWDAFIHCRYAVDPSRPWRGVGPLGWASDTGLLAANLEKRLGEEAGGAVAHLLPVPSDGGDGSGDDPLAALKPDIRKGKGRTLLVETTAAGYGEGRSAAPQRDMVPSRLGADPPDVLGSLRSDAALSVLGACGVPPSLASTVSSDGTAQRESWRRFLHGSVQPLSLLIAEELGEKLDVPGLKLSFDSLFASDLSGRARAFQSMTKAGLPIEKAAGLAGLMEGE